MLQGVLPFQYQDEVAGKGLTASSPPRPRNIRPSPSPERVPRAFCLLHPPKSLAAPLPQRSAVHLGLVSFVDTPDGPMVYWFTASASKGRNIPRPRARRFS